MIISNGNGTIKIGNIEFKIDNWQFEQALDEAAAQVLEQARKVEPTLVGDIHRLTRDFFYSAFTEFDRPSSVAPKHFIDSTAIVIDENVKALILPDLTETKESEKPE